MTEISVKVEGLDELLSKLRGYASSVDKFISCIEAGARVIQIYALDNARNKLNKHPVGHLTNALAQGIRIEGETVLVGAFGVVYAAIHEFGGIITPRRAEYLHFVIDGRHIKTKLVHIPARPYLRPAVDEHQSEILQAVHDAADALIFGGDLSK